MEKVILFVRNHWKRIILTLALLYIGWNWMPMGIFILVGAYLLWDNDAITEW